MREGWVDDDKGMVNDVEGVQNLGERDVKLHREGSSVCVVVVLFMAAVGAVVLVVVVVLMIVVGVVCLQAVEMDCSGMVDIRVR